MQGMNDYTSMLYRMIGRRFRERRKKAKMTQADFMPTLDTTIVSKIENGKAEKKRNPHFLNNGKIQDICAFEELDITPYELIWGTEEEKTELVKIWTLSVLLNSCKNPFKDCTFEQWLMDEWIYDPGREKDNIPLMVEKYGYFISPERYGLYGLLKTEFDNDYERISNLILKQLMLDYQFSKKFFFNLIPIIVKYQGIPIEKVIENLILNKGNYADAIFDSLDYGYVQFILAFHAFWNRTAEQYLAFFEEHLFGNGDTLLKEGMKNINNDRIHNLFICPEFIEMNERLLYLPEYTEPEAIFASLDFRLKLIGQIREPLLDMADDYEEIHPFDFSFRSIKDSFEENVKDYFAYLKVFNKEE